MLRLAASKQRCSLLTENEKIIKRFGDVLGGHGSLGENTDNMLSHGLFCQELAVQIVLHSSMTSQHLTLDGLCVALTERIFHNHKLT